jgi:hypothetical protein
MRWAQMISRKGQWEALKGHRFSDAARELTIRALAPEVALLVPLESSETVRQIPIRPTRNSSLRSLREPLAEARGLPKSAGLRNDARVWVIGKDTVRTAWRHAEGGRNVHSTSQTSMALERATLSG